MNLKLFLLGNLCNAVMAMVLLLTGFKLFDWLTPGWDFAKAFAGKNHTNGALVVAAFLLGLSIVIAAGGF